MKHTWKWKKQWSRPEWVGFDSWIWMDNNEFIAVPRIPLSTADRTLARLRYDREIELFSQQIVEALSLIEQLSVYLEGRSLGAK